ERALVFVVAQCEMPVAGEPRSGTEQGDEDAEGIPERDQADDADQKEEHAPDAQKDAAHEPECSDSEDRNAKSRDHFRLPWRYGFCPPSTHFRAAECTDPAVRSRNGEEAIGPRRQLRSP